MVVAQLTCAICLDFANNIFLVPCPRYFGIELINSQQSSRLTELSVGPVFDLRTLQVPSLDPLLVSDPWLWLDGLKSQFTICIRFAMERGCWQRGLMVCGAWWGWGGGAIGIQKATLMSCRLTPRFDTRRALEYPMLSDVRMQLRRSRQNRMFARQGSGQNSRAHP